VFQGGVGVQKNIRIGCGVFSRFVKYEVGDGSKIKFCCGVGIIP
jgi:hypothetical protein